MKPWLHAMSSARKWGGVPEDYLAVHDFMDSTKGAHATVKHRAVLHNAFGVFLAERVFGHNLTNSAGRLVSVRDVAEQHVIEDLGTIPSLGDWLKCMTIETWMGGPARKTRTVSLDDLKDPEIGPGILKDIEKALAGRERDTNGKGEDHAPFID